MYESNGPDVKIRGTASHIAEKYLQLARDAQSSGDPVAAENYYQHAEHYFRLIAAAQEQFRQTQPYYQQQRANARQSLPMTAMTMATAISRRSAASRSRRASRSRSIRASNSSSRTYQPQHMQPQQHAAAAHAAAAHAAAAHAAAASAPPAAALPAGRRRGCRAAALVHHRRPAAATGAATGPRLQRSLQRPQWPEWL